MPQADTDKIKILSKNLFPVVGIGASAGGLEAFRKLIKAIPENSGMAYILVQHLHPDHSSTLPEILQRETTIRVNEISDNVKVEPDNIYIIPSNKMLVATDGVLQLSPRPSKDQINMPIDIFFSSLAEIHQSHAIGIVLSGTGADGTIGLKSIKDQGGLTFAQDIESAAYDGMPQSAIDAKVVDFILPPEKMPQQLLELNRTYNLLPLNEHATPGQLTEEDSFKKILAVLRTRNGVDFTYYKQTTVRRRILRRMVLVKQEKFVDYLEHLKLNKTEQDILFQDMLIPVTAFFRDPKTFENLCETVFPELIKNKSSVNPLRIWIAGCSTGEEAYSMGMCLHEYLSDKISGIKIQIFATDISEKAIAKARTGIYDKRELEGMPDAKLHQFFTRINGSYQLKKNIRDMCVFAAHNFLKDPPFAKMDFISCRNVLIYMEPFLQKKAFTTFHYALNAKGYLLLGKSETIGNSSDLFLPFGKKEKIYTRKPVLGRFMNVASERREDAIKDQDYGLRSNERKKDDFQKNADDILLSRFTPAGVIVNEQLDIVQFRGSVREFLEPATGKASLSVLKMAREGLAFEIRNALHKVKKTNEPFSKEGIYIDGGKKTITIEVFPLLNTIDLHFLILFKENVQAKANTYQEPGNDDEQTTPGNINSEKDVRIQQLEKELLRAREDMRSITEDQEAINEELQSANEELLSGSEEMQSLNEELETSKEELQSSNEELIIVNQELYDRNEQLNEARFYAEAIVTTVHEPLLVLSQDFRIKSANKSFYKNFLITEEEAIGKILFDLQNFHWDIPGLRTQLLRIQRENEKFIEWEATYLFPSAGSRTICFNAQPFQKENGENWILLAMEDITRRRHLENIEKELLNRFQNLVEQAPVAIMILKGKDYTVELANDFYLQLVEKEKDFIGKPIFESIPEFKTQGIKELLDSVMQSGSPYYGYETKMQMPRHKKSKQGFFNFVYNPVREPDNIITRIMVVITEVTEQVLIRKKIEESEAHFRQMAELMPAKISSADTNGNVFYFNQRWMDYTGLGFEELKHLGYYKIMHPDELEEFKRRFQKATEAGTNLEMEMRFMNKDGVYKWHLNRASPVKDDSGKIKMWIGATTDIHDQKTKEESKDEFISIASHELKTPLTTAKAYIHLLEQGMEHTKNKDLIYAQKATASIDRLNDLIGELLDVSKIQNGKLGLHITHFDFNEMIASAIEGVQYASPTHTIILSGKIKQPVSGDKDRLQQVVINLLSNAVKYSPKAKEVFINIALENGEVKVSVKDKGIGILKENLRKIFERYYREAERAVHFQGLGIGLYISYDIIQQHKGKLWAESQPGKGSTFCFNLPV